MKNIHRINGLIYITSDVEVLDGEYGACLHLIRVGLSANSAIFKMDKRQRRAMEKLGGRKKAEVVKLILTNDPALITDGIQAISPTDEKWLNENTSCERVEHKKVEFEVDMGLGESCVESGSYYKINLPTHQTIEEAADVYFPMPEYKTGDVYFGADLAKLRVGFIHGAKSQAARDYWYNIFKSEQQC